MNGIMEIRRQVRLSQWSAMVREREESGLSVKAYCKQTGIATKTYYYRLRKLREATVEQARSKATQPELVQLCIPLRNRSCTGFEPHLRRSQNCTLAAHLTAHGLPDIISTAHIV